MGEVEGEGEGEGEEEKEEEGGRGCIMGEGAKHSRVIYTSQPSIISNRGSGK